MSPMRLSSLLHLGKAAACGAAAYAAAFIAAVAGMLFVPESDGIDSLFLSSVAALVGLGLLLSTFVCSSAVALRPAEVGPVSSVLPVGCGLGALYTYAAMTVLGLPVEVGPLPAMVTLAAGLATAAMLTDHRWEPRWRKAVCVSAVLTLSLGVAAGHLRGVELI